MPDQKVINQIAVAAVAAERATGCPAELLAAQCAIESGWLKFAPGSNCFGIKAYPGCYDRQLLRTTEFFTPDEMGRFAAQDHQRTANLKPGSKPRKDGRQEYAVRDWFATFKTLGDCFAKRAAMFDKGRYKPFADAFRKDKNIEDLVRGIAPIYATDPSYVGKVLDIIGNAQVRAALAAARQ